MGKMKQRGERGPEANYEVPGCTGEGSRVGKGATDQVKGAPANGRPGCGATKLLRGCARENEKSSANKMTQPGGGLLAASSGVDTQRVSRRGFFLAERKLVSHTDGNMSINELRCARLRAQAADGTMQRKLEELHRITGKKGELALRALAPRTQTQYKSQRAIMEEYAKCGIEEITEESYLRFLKWRMVKFGLEPSTLRTYRATLLHYQKDLLPKQLRWAEDEGFQRRARGMEQSAAKHVRPRGGITLDRLQQVKKECAKLPKKRMLRLGFSLAYMAMLRRAELMALRREDLRVQGNELVVTVLRGKGRKNKTGYQVVETRVKDGAQFIKWFEDVPPKELLFPQWDTVAAAKVIEDTCKKYKWTTELWFSFHSLRHGSAEDMKQAGVSLKDICTKGRWLSTSMADYYSRRT